MTSVLMLDGASRFYGKLLDVPSSVLVLGAGDGVVAAALASRHEVVAVEASASLRSLINQHQQLVQLHRLKVIADDPRTLTLERKFSLVIAPHQAIGLTRNPEELQVFLSVMAKHLEPEGTFAFDALNGPPGDTHGPRGIPHLRERNDAIVRLTPLRLSAQTIDEALQSVGLLARQRFSDFNETPFTVDAQIQVVVGGHE